MGVKNFFLAAAALAPAALAQGGAYAQCEFMSLEVLRNLKLTPGRWWNQLDWRDNLRLWIYLHLF